MNRILVFVGPSVPRSQLEHLPVTLRPPARSGDLSAAVTGDTIVFIDAAFMHDAPPAHRELLQLLSSGIRIVGSGSMGALRATELKAYGMVGRGDIFAAYEAGVLTDDGEIAVSMQPDTWQATTIALVNVRRLLALAQHANAPRGKLSMALRIASDTYFLERTPARLWDSWDAWDSHFTRRLHEVALNCEWDAKLADATSAIREVALSPQPAVSSDLPFKHGLFLDQP